MEQEQQLDGARRGPDGAPLECPYCSTPLSGEEYERAASGFQKAVDDALGSTPNVKYKKTMRSLKNSNGIEITSKEEYERLGESSLIRAAVALTRFSAAVGSRSRSAYDLARTKYNKAAMRVKRRTKSLASKVYRWLDKWLFFIFKGTEESLTKVTG